MTNQTETQGLWLRTRYRQDMYEGEACLLVYDAESLDDSIVGGDVKRVFEQRAGTANIFISAPFVRSQDCREALKTGVTVQRAMSYLSTKSGRVYLLEAHVDADSGKVSVKSIILRWDEASNEVKFEGDVPLANALREGWLFDLFDSSGGLVVAPPGVHFRKSSKKHAEKFLRAANTLTSSSACGLLALFALAELDPRTPKRILVDTAPLISVSYAMMRIAKNIGVWSSEVPTRSFSSYGGQSKLGRLSINDVVLISATTSGSLAESLLDQKAVVGSIITLFFLSSNEGARPSHVLCDLTVSGERGIGYQPVENLPAVGCRLCKSDFILAEFEGDQFLLQERQHRLIKFVLTTQCGEARSTLTELYSSKAIEVVLRPDSTRPPTTIEINEEPLLASPAVRQDLLRLLRRYTPHPLALIVRVNIAEDQLATLFADAGIQPTVATAQNIEWTRLEAQPILDAGQGVLVVFGCLPSHTVARQINASLRSIVNEGNVTYISALTLAETPEQYQDLKLFLGYGERGPETFTYRDARRLALPGPCADTSPWLDELGLLNRLGNIGSTELDSRRASLSNDRTTKEGLFWPGIGGPLAIQRDFVYLDTRIGTRDISQADVFAVVSNLFAAARAGSGELAKKREVHERVLLTQSVYGHVLLTPEAFMTFNDGILKASLLRAARKSELMYEVDAGYSARMLEIVLAELAGWRSGTGEALPEILLALATSRLRLREADCAAIRTQALATELPLHIAAVANSIPRP
jgi:hypothetical protein